MARHPYSSRERRGMIAVGICALLCVLGAVTVRHSHHLSPQPDDSRATSGADTILVPAAAATDTASPYGSRKKARKRRNRPSVKPSQATVQRDMLEDSIPVIMPDDVP